MTTYNFYDTSSLLLRANNLFNNLEENIVISSVTLMELENIKTSRFKSEEIKFQARQITHLLEQNPDKYICHQFRLPMLDRFKDFDITDDINAANFIWTRKSKNTTDDTRWNTNHSGGTKSINIGSSDVWGRSVFYCTVTLPDGTSAAGS